MTVDVSLRLRLYRERAGLTQREAAAKSSVGEKTISSYETGNRAASIKLLHVLALCLAYNVRPMEFFDPANPIDARDLPVDAAPDEATNDAVAGRDLPLRRTRVPHDPLAAFTRRETTYPTPQSTLARGFVGHVSTR